MPNINKQTNEAEASILLQMNGMAVPYIIEWFEARRLLGLESYSKENLIEVLKKKLKTK